MRRLLADWLWRAAVIGVLGVIAWELQRIHEDIVTQPVDDQATLADAPDDVQDSLDAIRDDIAGLTYKVNAILVVMARAK